jgi:microcompartment protein CcmL/EutN
MPGLIKGKALGLIETVGLVGAIEACDAAAKAADVIVSAAEITDGALVTLKIFGELGAVQSAVEAGSAAASRVGQLLSAHIIPNPDDNLEAIMGGSFRGKLPKSPSKVRPANRSNKGTTIPTSPSSTKAISYKSADMNNIEKMRVTQLRAFARTIPNLSIKGREISRAGKEILLKEIRNALGIK